MITTLVIAASALIASTDTDPSIDQIIDASKEARVIILGESHHGDGGSMTARLQLLRRLHAEADVRWVVFESSVFDATRANARFETEDDSLSVWSRGVLDLWSASEELDPLAELFSGSRKTDHPLQLAGMDITPLHLAEGCAHCSELRSQFAAIEADWALDAIDVIARLEIWTDAFDPYTRPDRPDDLLANLLGLAERVETHTDQIDTKFGRGTSERIALDLIGWHAWIELLISQTSEYDRDELMARNVLSLLDRIEPTDRVVIWTHNVHAARSFEDARSPTGEPAEGLPTPVGYLLEERLGDDAVYVLATGAISGQIRQPWNNKIVNLPEPGPTWLESRAKAEIDPHTDSVFFGRGRLQGDCTTGLITSMPIQMDWSRAYDGVWLLKETHPSTPRVTDE